MSNTDQIEALLLQVQQLRNQIRPVSRDEEFKSMESRMEKAIWKAQEAEKERDLAVAELAKVKSDVAWTMEKLRIKDLMFMRGTDISCAGEGWLPLNRDPKDTERIEWINSNCRIGVSNNHWLLSIPHNLNLDTAELPTPYNIRHIIDLSMELASQKQPHATE